MSISLWDLRSLNGLLIDGIFYVEVVLTAKQILGKDDEDKSFLSPSCIFLLFALDKLAGDDSHSFSFET